MGSGTSSAVGLCGSKSGPSRPMPDARALLIVGGPTLLLFDVGEREGRGAVLRGGEGVAEAVREPQRPGNL